MSEEAIRLVDKYGSARALGGVVGCQRERGALLAYIERIERERDEAHLQEINSRELEVYSDG